MHEWAKNRNFGKYLPLFRSNYSDISKMIELVNAITVIGNL